MQSSYYDQILVESKQLLFVKFFFFVPFRAKSAESQEEKEKALAANSKFPWRKINSSENNLERLYSDADFEDPLR